MIFETFGPCTVKIKPDWQALLSLYFLLKEGIEQSIVIRAPIAEQIKEYTWPKKTLTLAES
jgi:hypothetical protein